MYVEIVHFINIYVFMHVYTYIESYNWCESIDVEACLNTRNICVPIVNNVAHAQFRCCLQLYTYSIPTSIYTCGKNPHQQLYRLILALRGKLEDPLKNFKHGYFFP